MKNIYTVGELLAQLQGINKGTQIYMELEDGSITGLRSLVLVQLSTKEVDRIEFKSN